MVQELVIILVLAVVITEVLEVVIILVLVIVQLIRSSIIIYDIHKYELFRQTKLIKELLMFV